MKILAIIPARGGSKGVSRKNIKMLGGQELIRYTIEAGINCSLIGHLIVSTEDAVIAKISKDAGADVPFLRPEKLASDESPTIDTVMHTVNYFQSKEMFFDAVCLLQPTVPFRAQDDLKNTIQTFIKGDYDSLFTVRKVPHQFNPYWVYRENKNGFLEKAVENQPLITRRQSLPDTYYRDGSVYLTKMKVLLEQKDLYGEKIGYFEMRNSPNINIDTLSDWEKAVEYQRKSQKLNG